MARDHIVQPLSLIHIFQVLDAPLAALGAHDLGQRTDGGLVGRDLDVGPETQDSFDFTQFDYVVDAIDTDRSD